MTVWLAAIPVPRAFAERSIPAASNWSQPDASHPLGSGALTSAAPSLPASAAAAGGFLGEGLASDQGFFRHRPAGEGDDFRVCLGAASTSGVAGVMARDSASPDSAFVFAGTDATGTTVVLFRHEAGAPARRIVFSATGANKWFRLVVGRDAVYAFDASAATPGLAGSWNFLAAVKVRLAGGGFQQRRSDLAGFFLSDGAATVADLHQTSQLLWSETTATVEDAVQSPPGSWEATPPGPGQFAESATVLKRENRGEPAHLDFPLATPVAGTYRVYVHAVAGNGSPVRAALVVGGVPQAASDLDNLPAGVNSWLYLGNVATTPGPGREFGVRIFDPGTPGASVHADAVRAVFVNARESGTLHFPGWTETPGERIAQTGGGTAANDLRRNGNAAVNAWNAGAYSNNVLVGDGVFKFRFVGDELRMQAGLTDSPGGNDPATIDHRFTNKAHSGATGRVQALGGGSSAEFAYVNGDWLEIERIGSQILFRRNGALCHCSTLPASNPLRIDTTFMDEDARVFGARILGAWTAPAQANDLDGDGAADTLERWVVDADPEDGIQAVFHVDMASDPDADGLTNQEEHDLEPKTDPTKEDTDGDGLGDGAEVATHLTSPSRADSDGDGLGDGLEVRSGLGFDPLSADSDGDGVGDSTEWEIIADALATGRAQTDQRLVLGADDYDADGVGNRHESEDRTSAVDRQDYFLPVAFDRLFGRHSGADHAVEQSAAGILSTRLVRTAAAGAPSGGVSHHEAKDGTRVRFQFLGLDADPAGSRATVGFSHRGLDADEPGDLANYAVAIRQAGEGEARVYFHGAPAPGADPFVVAPSDLIELRLEDGAIHLERNLAPVGPPLALPAGFAGIDREAHPLAVVVGLDGAGSGVHNLRYRRVDDPDSDGDGMADRWERRILDAFPARFAHLAQVEPGGDADGDALSNQREYELGTDPVDPDSDGDGMPDGWEVGHGLNPANPADGAETTNPDGSPAADLDGDGLSNLREFQLGTRPDRLSTAGDGFSDGWKARWGLDPASPLAADGDGDGDGLDNATEHSLGINPASSDSDGDGSDDGAEVAQGTDPGEAPLPMPAVVLQGRTHRTRGGWGNFAGYYGGSEEQLIIETRYRNYRIMLVRDILDFENVKTGEELLDFIAPAEEFPTELDLKLNDGWRKVNENDQPQGLDPYQHTEIFGGGPGTWLDAAGSPFWAEGPVLPGFTKGQVGELAGEEAIRAFYEDEERFRNDPDFHWTGSLASATMGFPGGWTALHHRAFGQSPHLGAPETSSHARFLTGILPEASWTEYWLQADGPVPRLKTVERTLLLRATQRDETGAVTLDELGAATFTIPGTKDLSEGAPRVGGLSQAASWVEAGSGGTLLVKPPVERGVEREVRLLPVEVVELAPKLRDLTTGDEIDGTEVPDLTEGNTNPMVERTPVQDRIAHRDIKIKIGDGDALEGKKVTWSMAPLFTPPGSEDPVFRGEWTDSETHPNRFEASTEFEAYGFEEVSQEEGRTEIDADGFTGIRVNLPPIGFNKARISIQVEGTDTPIELIDMEVPAIVVIDPGHGGTENRLGSSWNNATSPSGILEKDMTLTYAETLRDSIEEHASDNNLQIRVVMTREEDVNYSGEERANVARDFGADIFQSFHFNAANGTARGSESLIRGTANVNEDEDEALGRRVLDGVLEALSEYDPEGIRDRGVKNYAWSASQGQNVPSSWAALSDGSYSNVEGYHPIRGNILEVEFIDVEAVDQLLNGEDAAAIRGAVGKDVRDAIIEDINHQPGAE